MNLDQGHTGEENDGGKLVNVIRKLNEPELLEWKSSLNSENVMPNFDQASVLGISGINGRMEWDGKGTEDGMRRMRLRVGTVEDEGSIGGGSAGLSGKIVRTVAENIGITGNGRDMPDVSVGKADDRERLLVGTIPKCVQKKKDGKSMVRKDNESPGLKRNLKPSSSSSGLKFGKDMLGRGSAQAVGKSRTGDGKLSKAEKVKMKEKIKLFEMFQKGGSTKTIGASVTTLFESTSNTCLAGNSRREQAVARGPMGADHTRELESRTRPCGLRQEVDEIHGRGSKN